MCDPASAAPAWLAIFGEWGDPLQRGWRALFQPTSTISCASSWTPRSRSSGLSGDGGGAGPEPTPGRGGGIDGILISAETWEDGQLLAVMETHNPAGDRLPLCAGLLDLALACADDPRARAALEAVRRYLRE